MTRMQFRLECIKLANMLAAAKQIAPNAVIARAEEYFKWVDDAPEDDSEIPFVKQSGGPITTYTSGQ